MIKHLSAALIVMCTMTANTWPDNIPSLLEENIPFDIRISDQPGKHCDPLELIVEIGANEQFRWLVMDSEKVLFEFETFDDLYYQCDGPGCFIISIRNAKAGKKWHVCLK